MLPLVILGLGATQVSVDSLTAKVSDSQARAADQLASEIDLWLQFQASLIADQVDAFRMGRLNDRKLEGFQRLAFQQLSDVNIVAVVNGEGAELVPSLFLDAPAEGALSTKDTVDITRLAEFRAALPVARMEKERLFWSENPGNARPAVVGRPYTPTGRINPVLPIAVPDGPESAVFLAVELSMERFGGRFQAAGDDGLSVALLDGSGQLALSRGPNIVEPQRFKVFQSGTAAAEIAYTTQGGTEVLSACAPVPGTRWLVVVAEPKTVITEAGDEINARTTFIGGVAAILSLLLGLLVSGGIATRLTRVRDAALSVAEGNLGRTVALEGASEIRDLSRAFNFMSRRLASNQNRIADQQAEIEAFNEELQRQLVAQELRLTDAHRAVLQSGRLAAVGEMGAGLAHELNNPLAGILGLVQVLKLKDGSPRLDEIESQARRCSEIVAKLLKFSRSQEPGTHQRSARMATLNMGELLSDVVGLVSGPFSMAGLEVSCTTADNLRVHGDSDALTSAFIQLLNSVRSASGSTGTLRVTGQNVDGEVHISFALSSIMIDGQSDDWKAAGMGFWLARQVFANHNGRLVEPALSANARTGTWTIRIPGV